MKERSVCQAIVCQAIAMAFGAWKCCADVGNDEWFVRHAERIERLVKECLPSGSGFDNGTTFDFDSKPDRLVFFTAFHHMNEGGMYDGWTEHQVIVTPSLQSAFELRVTGVNRNEIKDYIADTFHHCLSAPAPDFQDEERAAAWDRAVGDR